MCMELQILLLLLSTGVRLDLKITFTGPAEALKTTRNVQAHFLVVKIFAFKLHLALTIWTVKYHKFRRTRAFRLRNLLYQMCQSL